MREPVSPSAGLRQRVTQRARLAPGLAIGLLLGLLLLAGPAAAAVGPWVPPPPPPPSPPIDSGPGNLDELRTVGAVHIVWSRGLHTGMLALSAAHFFSEVAGRDASSALIPETVLLWGHAATFIAGPWGYAMALDDGRPHRRHLGLAIGLIEQAVYGAGIATLNLGARQLYFGQNECHVPGVQGRACIDDLYRPRANANMTILYIASGASFAFGMLHLAAAAQLMKLERRGVMDGPLGDAYREAREPKPIPGRKKVQGAWMIAPWGSAEAGGLGVYGIF